MTDSRLSDQNANVFLHIFFVFVAHIHFMPDSDEFRWAGLEWPVIYIIDLKIYIYYFIRCTPNGTFNVASLPHTSPLMMGWYHTHTTFSIWIRASICPKPRSGPLTNIICQTIRTNGEWIIALHFWSGPVVRRRIVHIVTHRTNHQLNVSEFEQTKKWIYHLNCGFFFAIDAVRIRSR